MINPSPSAANLPRLCSYQSPLGEILLAADSGALVGLWFSGQCYLPAWLSSAVLQPLPVANSDSTAAVLRRTALWLDTYFSGREPAFIPTLAPVGTPFRQQVWHLLLQIPYGQTVTYGHLASQMARAKGVPTMSAQAIGGAVGHNPISLIIPCHRVIGANGNLTGYAGGVERKERLLYMERRGSADLPTPLRIGK